MVGQIVLLLNSAVCMVGGIMFLCDWYKTRNIDLRPFSLRRFLFFEKGYNPIEKLLLAILGLTTSVFTAYIAILMI
ncbi:hypothetical protein HFN16_05125 [Pseudodesulfovibrio sp. zrk46]|nr:hypothetical protein HFN16_05125 [Pseudodesulfovibrio sp. zrk46]